MSQPLVLHLAPQESGALTRLSLRGPLERPLPPRVLHRLLRMLALESGHPVHVALRVDALEGITFNSTFLESARTRGFAVHACNVRPNEVPHTRYPSRFQECGTLRGAEGRA